MSDVHAVEAAIVLLMQPGFVDDSGAKLFVVWAFNRFFTLAEDRRARSEVRC